MDRLKNQYGQWVLITGATSGIGKELAVKFGEAGFNLVITGRRKNLLSHLAQELKHNKSIEIIEVEGDLSNEEGIKDLIDSTRNLTLGIVVLNAGYGTSGKFIDAEIETEMNMLDLNCKSVLVLTHHFSRKMREQSQKGALVLLSSMVAFQGVPNAANYAATKAYVQSLGEALAIELKQNKIDILCAAPGPVNSGFSERANMKMNSALSVTDISIPIIKAIGKRSTLFPGFLTKFLIYNLRLTPRWAKVRIMGKVMAGFTKHQNH